MYTPNLVTQILKRRLENMETMTSSWKNNRLSQLRNFLMYTEDISLCIQFLRHIKKLSFKTTQDLDIFRCVLASSQRLFSEKRNIKLGMEVVHLVLNEIEKSLVTSPTTSTTIDRLLQIEYTIRDLRFLKKHIKQIDHKLASDILDKLSTILNSFQSF